MNNVVMRANNHTKQNIEILYALERQKNMDHE